MRNDIAGDGRRRRVVGWALRATLFGMVCGALYGVAVAPDDPSAALRGAVIGCAVAVSLSLFELVLLESIPAATLRRLPFAVLWALKAVVYLAIIAGAEHVGSVAVPMTSGRVLDSIGPIQWTTLFAFALALAVNFVVQVARLLGQGELGRFVVGRYHRPRQEERVFLVLDLVDSTGIAEHLGGVRFLELLSAILGRIDGLIVAHGGAIHKYNGDEVIITWRVAAGLRGARCVRCALAIETTLAKLAPSFESGFSVAPRFRYAVHLGPVVSGELGTTKREIAYLGDTVNTTERMLDACRARGVSVVASEALLKGVALPSGIVANAMGPVALRGKAVPVVLFALSQAAQPYRSAADRSDRGAARIHRSTLSGGVPAAARALQ